MDAAAANLAKLDAVWARAHPLLPTGPSFGTTREYADLERAWKSLLPGLAPIDGWTITEPLPDADEIGQEFIDYAEIGELPASTWAKVQAPGNALDEYRFRLAQARRRAIRERLAFLAAEVGGLLPNILAGVPRDSFDEIQSAATDNFAHAISEIETLLGDTTARRGRWGDMHRHMAFSQGHDWHDIAELDWPSVRADIEAASLSEADPIPVPDIDLGTAAESRPAGGVTTGLAWASLDDDGFERLLFDLFRGLDGYQNVEWLMQTRAPDRGRDLSAERLLSDAGGTTRVERVIIQAKHWLSRSVGPGDIQTALASLSLWEPPVIRGLVIATSGRFTADAVGVAERHNELGTRPFIELWPDSRLETLVSQRPDLIATNNLRATT